VLPKLKNLQKEVKEQIILWGGVSSIDEYLKKHDHDHGLISVIEELDTSWLYS